MNILSYLFTDKKIPDKTGIVLSGGGVRGIAHLGVLKALNEKGIFPEIISGVSAGAIAGVFYADGYTPDEIFNIFNDNHLFHFAKLTIPKKGFLSMEKVSAILNKHIRAKSFEDLKIPFYAAATNLNEGKIEYFHKGPIVERIIASASIPVLFRPVIMNNTIYVDGGVFDNLPIDPIKDSCDFIIASHVNPLTKEENIDSILEIAERTFHLAIGSSVQENKAFCKLFIEPEELKGFGLLKIEKAKEIFDIGYVYTHKLLEKNFTF